MCIFLTSLELAEAAMTLRGIDLNPLVAFDPLMAFGP